MIRSIARSLTRLVVDRERRPRGPSKTVAIMVPVSDRSELLPEEQVSLRHLRHFLGRYDTFYVTPRGSRLKLAGFERIDFPAKFFGSMRAYNRMMYLPELYAHFEEYKYILVYHLDSLAFSDELLAWCETDVDYIGAPWIPGADCPWVAEPRVGNGGFALMKIERVLKVLENRYRAEPLYYWKDVASRNLSRFVALEADPEIRAPVGLTGRFLETWRRIQSTESNGVLNDVFWSVHASRYLADFRIPDWTVALRFAFEVSPRHCFDLNGHRLPFGCHAWARYDRAFWEPYLLQ
jgi:hypothetical protein